MSYWKMVYVILENGLFLVVSLTFTMLYVSATVGLSLKYDAK